MNDFEVFKAYWEEAVNALCYRVKTKDQAMLTESAVRDIWQEELLSSRFFSSNVRHAASVFLEELESRKPETAARVKKMLLESRLEGGIDPKAALAKASVATAALGAGLATVASRKNSSIIKGLAASLSAVVAGLAVKAGVKELRSANSKTLLRDLLDQTQEQLAAYQAVLEQP